jgi:hypothetical protein
MNGLRRGLLAAASAAFVAGCGDSSSSGSAGAGRVESNAGSYSVSFESSPRPIPLNAPFDLRFTVSRKDGSKVKPAVEVDARMPQHRHGMSRMPRLTEQPDGSFRAEGLLFHMPGLWELYFDITEAGRTERAQVSVRLE